MNYRTLLKNITLTAKEVFQYTFSSCKKYYKKALLTLFPAKFIATFFGIGYLPEWQAHWASFVVIPIIALMVYIFTGFEGNIIVLSIPVVIFLIFLFFLGIISIYIFHLNDKSANTEIMIHIVFGQAFVVAFSAPAVVYLGVVITTFNNMICTKFMYCAPWFYSSVTYIPILCVPFIAYRFMDYIKPWPASILDKDYNSCFSKMFEALIVALYTLLMLYAIAFMFFGLTMDEAIIFFKGVLYGVIPNIDEIFIVTMEKINSIGLFKILFLQDYYDNLIKDYYNVSQQSK